MKVLELFSGTESISKTFRKRGHKTFTVDFNDRFNADLCKDITKLRPHDIPFKPDVIWASPPCQCFSVASIGKHWGGGKKAYVPKTFESEWAKIVVITTLEIIISLNPKVWFIENPRGILRKMPFMKNLPRHTITYCQYGDKRMKPTDIWTNCKIWKPKPMCKNGGTCHESSPRGSRRGTQGLQDATERGKIPLQLCEEIVHICEEVLHQE